MKLIPIFFFVITSSFAFGQFNDKKEFKKATSEILDIIKRKSMVRDSIDWPEFTHEIENEVDNADLSQANFIIYKIIRKLRSYGDNHSIYQDKIETETYYSKKDSISYPTSKLINGNIGLLILPSHLSMNPEENLKYATILREEIQNLDQNQISGWIVDVRENEGGNMWPMIAGLNPLIQDGIVGFFASNKTITNWYSKSIKPIGVKRMTNNYKCKDLSKKIAVLISDKTASSGEMTAISLLGRENSKTFGNKTAGYTTANAMYKLSNGATLLLAVSYSMDKNKKKYTDGINPDIWMDSLLTKIKSEKKDLVISDLTHHREISSTEKTFPNHEVVTIKLNRYDVEHIDKSLINYDFNLNIDNTRGQNQLFHTLDNFMKHELNFNEQ